MTTGTKTGEKWAIVLSVDLGEERTRQLMSLIGSLADDLTDNAEVAMHRYDPNNGRIVLAPASGSTWI